MKHWVVRSFSKKRAFTVFCVFLSLLSATEISGAAGELDLSFGVQGRQLVTVSTNPVTAVHNNTTDIVVQPDGKILVAGYAYIAVNQTSGDDFIVMRFNPDGTLDSGFATGGIFRYDFDGGSDELRGIALQPDGKIVAAGEVQINPFNPNPNTAFAVIRLSPSGTFDSTFGTNGLVVTDFLASLDQATEVAIQPDGKILASGWSTRSNTNTAGMYDFALVRYNPNGSLDASFGSGGSVFTDFNGSGDLAQSSVLQPDGKIVLAGWVWAGSASQYDFGLARYNSDGTLDASFGNGGKVVTPIGNNQSELVRGMALAPGGKLVVTGDLYNPTNGNVQGNWDVVAVRFNANGSLDASFDGDGKFIYASTLGDRSESGGDTVVQPDGKILLTGKSHLRTESVPGGTASHTELFIIRLNVNGSFDASFGSGGITLTDFGVVSPEPTVTKTGDSGEAITLQPDGKIVAAGEAVLGNGDYRFVIARFLNDIPPLVSSRALFDFDGDNKADISIFRPSEGIWYLLQSASGFATTRWGISTDKIVPADYDGDGRTDLAVFRSGENSSWYVLNSATDTIRIEQWGASNLEQQLLLTDTPVPADYDGDGKADLAVWRLTDDFGEPARFLIRQSAGNAARVEQWGGHSDRPVPADYDGDGKTDLAIYRSGAWWILNSAGNAVRVDQFGLSSDKPVPADYDGDGRADPAVYRGGAWWILGSGGGNSTIRFGLANDKPVPADYDGDGRADAAVFREGTWYLQRTTAGFTAQQFGLADDIPVPASFGMQ